MIDFLLCGAEAKGVFAYRRTSAALGLELCYSGLLLFSSLDIFYCVRIFELIKVNLVPGLGEPCVFGWNGLFPHVKLKSLSSCDLSL